MEFQKKYKELLELEEKENLNELTLYNHKVWPYLRNKIYGIMHKKFIREQGSFKSKLVHEEIKNKKMLLSNLNGDVDILFFLFNRTSYNDFGSSRDDHLTSLINQCEAEKISHEIVMLKNESILPISQDVFVIDDCEEKYQKHLKKNKKMNNFSHIDEKISLLLGEKFTCATYMNEISSKINTYHEYFEKIYKKNNIKHIFITSNYMRSEVVIPAKKLGIKVTEIQYAAITDFHNGYHFSKKLNPINFPDELLVWSNFFKDYRNYPHDNIKVIGKDMPIQKIGNKFILIVSQNFISKKMEKIALTIAKNLTKEKIIYRPHPNEKISPCFLDEVSIFPNISVSTSTALYDVCNAKKIIACSSSLIYDALHFGKKVYIVDAYLKCFSNDILDRELVGTINENGELVDSVFKKEIIYDDIVKYDFSSYKKSINKEKVSYDLDVTICIPIFNGEKTIKRTLSSVYALKNVFFDVIVYNDGSTDDTLKILKNFEKRNENLKIINSSISSGSAAIPRNIMINMVKTKYIYFLDGDDVLYPNAFLYAIKIIDKKKLDFIKLTCNVVTSTDCFKYFSGRTFLNKKNSSVLKNSPFIWNGIYKKEIITDNNIKFVEGIAEDFNFNVKYFTYIKSMKVINKPLLLYDKRSSNLSKKNELSDVVSVLKNHIDACQNTKNNDLKDYIFNTLICQYVIYRMDVYRFRNDKNFLDLKYEIQNLFSKKIDIEEIYSNFFTFKIHIDRDNNNLVISSPLSKESSEFLGISLGTHAVMKDVAIAIENCELMLHSNLELKINNDPILFKNGGDMILIRFTNKKLRIKVFKSKILRDLILKFLYGNRIRNYLRTIKGV